MSSSESGPLAAIRQSAFDPIYKLWQSQVNAAGGISVQGTKYPVEVKVYDDGSDVNVMVQNLEKLITQDKVDFIFPPCSTAMAFAAAPVANKYGYILTTAEAGATTMEQQLDALPTTFVNLNYSDWNQLPVLADELSTLGVKTVYMVSTNDLFGLEYSGNTVRFFQAKGMQIVGNIVIPLTGANFSQIVSAAKDANADAFLTWCYPDQNMPITQESITQTFNPKFFITGPTANFGWYHTTWKEAALGVSCFASWSDKLSPEMATLAQNLYANAPEDAQDWWGHCYYWAGIQILQQSIEQAGTFDATGKFDQAKIAQYMQTNSFNTILSPTTRYTTIDDEKSGNAPCRGLLDKAAQPAEIGQWQKQADGTLKIELIAGNRTTAQALYPKPAWPAS